MKAIRSPALANLAAIVFGWVALRLFIIGMPGWLNATNPKSTPNLMRSMLVAQLNETAILTGPTARRLEQSHSMSASHHSIDMTQRHYVFRNDGFTNSHDVTPQAEGQRVGPLPIKLEAPLPNGATAAPSIALRRWTLSGYALIRAGGNQPGIAANGQLGGSQAGLRAQRLLLRAGLFTLSANARVSSPLEQKQGKEAGFGLALKRASRVPIELLVERRVGLDKGGRNAIAALMATGFDDFRLPGKILLSGYAQAGVVGLKRRDEFVDGAVRAEHPLFSADKVDVRIGAVIAGAKQPGVSRLDMGPAVAARFRISRASIRLAAEWRERISGNALPGSGPTVTLGFDY